MSVKICEASKDSLYYDSSIKYDKADIASQVSINYEGECDAITGYYKLIPFLKSVGDEESLADVFEIISDEKNHQEKLRKIQMKYDGDIPVNKD